MWLDFISNKIPMGIVSLRTFLEMFYIQFGINGSIFPEFVSLD